MDIHYSSKSNEWETPRTIFNQLNEEFNFQLDASATKDNALCANFFTLEDNSLIQDWSKYKSIFCNSPYGRMIGKFVEKAYQESQRGSTVVMLIPARVDTKWWHNYCAKGEVRFIKGRLKFVNKSSPSYSDDGNFKLSPAPFPSAIVIFRPNQISITKYVDIK